MRNQKPTPTPTAPGSRASVGLLHRRLRPALAAVTAAVAAIWPPFAHAAAADAAPAAPADLAGRIEEQARQLESLKRALAAQEQALQQLRRALAGDAGQEAAAAAAVGATAATTSATTVQATAATTSATTMPAATSTTPATATAATTSPTAQAPPSPPPPPRAPDAEAEAAVAVSQPPAAASLFAQPGVLTPAGKLLLEPSLQYAYSSSNRVALVGYTVIPAILVGLIDVREVKRTTVTAGLALRWGVGDRAEVEAKLPWVYRSDTSIGSRVGSASDNNNAVFNAGGKGIGDVEFTGRYQLNQGAADQPYYVASLRLKTRTGRDPFRIPVSTGIAGFQGDGLQTELPTGSGFWGVQPALTLLYPSDPAVFFGSVSYLHSVRRRDVVQTTDTGSTQLGTIAPGGIFGFNVGIGIALNERSSFSLGYDQSSVGKTRQNGVVVPSSVQLQLGTLLLGYALRLDERRSLNLTLGAGLTRDTPDMTLTLRVPTSF